MAIVHQLPLHEANGLEAELDGPLDLVGDTCFEAPAT